jgi:DNA-binding response OmpR family regulator
VSITFSDSCHAALKSIAAHPPDLVLLDVMMPGMNGFEVTRRLRQNPSLPFIPIFLVTANPRLLMDLMWEPMDLFAKRLILMTCCTKFGQFYSLET